jgi:ABC-type cobalamin transport system permease subunit
MKTIGTIFAGLLLVLGLASSANAATRVGVLRCYVAGGASFVVGSVHDARCTFTSAYTGRRERYMARVSRVGVDIGFTGPAMIVWAVYAPSTVGPRALTGNYIGASADAAIGVGGGANLLVGGNDRTVSLQPLSVKTETGIALAAGAGRLELR